MILGQTQSDRVPFTTPQGGGYMPQRPGVGFYSHLQPFASVMPPIMALTSGAGGRRGGNVSTRGGGGQVVASASPAAPGMSGGFGRGGFGSSGGVDPYRVMRSGMFPGIQASGSQMRRGVTGAGGTVRALMPAGFPNALNPANAQPGPATGPVSGWW
jgi:hypothetical protein